MRARALGGKSVNCLLTALIVVSATTAAYAQSSLTALASFGGGDGWRAPLEVLDGDTAGTTSVNGVDYNYLGIENLERGLAYNPVTGNLVLVSRSTAGNGIRLLDSTTGVDVGALNQGSGLITGGTFTTNMVGVADDGATYVANLQTSADSAAFKIYRWADAQSATEPSVFFSSTVTGYTGVPRLGDSLDVFGAGANTKLVAGVGPNGGPTGYTVFDSNGIPTTVTSFNPVNEISGGDFRLGITFAATANEVWGKQISQNAEFTTYSGAAGTGVASTLLTAAGEAPMDFAIIQGTPLLAAVDTNFVGGSNSPTVRVYDVSNPAAPALLASGFSTNDLLPGNPNGTGSVKWGAISGNTATLYALTSNQGIQAFTFTLELPVENSGDYNGNGVVDAADYTIWRDTLGDPVANGTGADGDNNGLIEQADFDFWKARFGNIAGNGAGAGAEAATAAVPEPANFSLLVLTALSCLLGGRNTWRRGC